MRFVILISIYNLYNFSIDYLIVIIIFINIICRVLYFIVFISLCFFNLVFYCGVIEFDFGSDKS